MPAIVLLNPYANRWKARRQAPEVRQALQDAGVRFEWAEMEGPGNGIALAASAAEQGFSPILIAGGDGTIGEVVNGLHKARPDGVLGPVGLLPLGTANDLAHNLGLPLDLAGAAMIIAAGNTRRIDLGKGNEWVFANNAAVGLEPMVTLHNMRMVRLKGVIRYLVAALRAINEKPNWTMSVRWDDGEFHGPLTLVSVGNCPLTGGLFRMAPAADPADGKLTFVMGYAPTRRKMLSLLPRTINGSFVNDPAIQQHHTTHLVIEANPPTPIQLDGEIRAESLTHIEYEILPAKLDILTP
jgi:diacylglycerol kinase (ATP)